MIFLATQLHFVYKCEASSIRRRIISQMIYEYTDTFDRNTSSFLQYLATCLN